MGRRDITASVLGRGRGLVGPSGPIAEVTQQADGPPLRAWPVPTFARSSRVGKRPGDAVPGHRDRLARFKVGLHRASLAAFGGLDHGDWRDDQATTERFGLVTGQFRQNGGHGRSRHDPDQPLDLVEVFAEGQF